MHTLKSERSCIFACNHWGTDTWQQANVDCVECFCQGCVLLCPSLYCNILHLKFFQGLKYYQPFTSHLQLNIRLFFQTLMFYWYQLTNQQLWTWFGHKDARFILTLLSPQNCANNKLHQQRKIKRCYRVFAELYERIKAAIKVFQNNSAQSNFIRTSESITPHRKGTHTDSKLNTSTASLINTDNWSLCSRHPSC